MYFFYEIIVLMFFIDYNKIINLNIRVNFPLTNVFLKSSMFIKFINIY